MSSSVVRYGLLFGAALVIGFFCSHLILGNSPDNFARGEAVGYSIMIISAIAVIYGIKDYKVSHCNGELRFLSGVAVGTGISAIASFLYAIYILVYLKFVNPEFTKTYMAWSEQQILLSGASQATIDQQLNELAAYSDFMSNDFLQAGVMFITVFIIGLLFSFVSAAAMRSPSTQKEK